MKQRAQGLHLEPVVAAPAGRAPAQALPLPVDLDGFVREYLLKSATDG